MRITKGMLAIVLSKLKSFERHGNSALSQKTIYEQYSTDSEIAAEILWSAYIRGDIADRVIADLGCGTGILGIGALLLDAKMIFFVDKDSSALSVVRENIKIINEFCEKEKKLSIDIERRTLFFEKDIRDFHNKSDTAVINPPFGTKVRHADIEFLKIACKTSPVIYSLHKSETSGYIIGFYQKSGFGISTIREFSFPLKASLSHHSRRIYRFKVCCIRAERLRK